MTVTEITVTVAKIQSTGAAVAPTEQRQQSDGDVELSKLLSLIDAWTKVVKQRRGGRDEAAKVAKIAATVTKIAALAS